MEGLGVLEALGFSLWRVHLLDLLPCGEYRCNIWTTSDSSEELLLPLEFFLLLFPEESQHLLVHCLLLLYALATLRPLLFLVRPLNHIDFEDELSHF